MKDLQIKYKNENGEIINREYDTIMDFIDEMESDDIDIPMLDYEIVEYMFFEKLLDRGYFATIDDILEYCKGIIKWVLKIRILFRKWRKRLWVKNIMNLIVN